MSRRNRPGCNARNARHGNTHTSCSLNTVAEPGIPGALNDRTARCRKGYDVEASSRYGANAILANSSAFAATGRSRNQKGGGTKEPRHCKDGVFVATRGLATTTRWADSVIGTAKTRSSTTRYNRRYGTWASAPSRALSPISLTFLILLLVWRCCPLESQLFVWGQRPGAGLSP